MPRVIEAVSKTCARQFYKSILSAHLTDMEHAPILMRLWFCFLDELAVESEYDSDGELLDGDFFARQFDAFAWWWAVAGHQERAEVSTYPLCV